MRMYGQEVREALGLFACLRLRPHCGVLHGTTTLPNHWHLPWHRVSRRK